MDFFEERLFGKKAKLNTHTTKEDLELQIDNVEIELEERSRELDYTKREVEKLNKEIIKVRTASANALLRLAETATNKFPHQLELDFVRECKKDSLDFLTSIEDSICVSGKTFAEDLRELHLSLIKNREAETFQESLRKLENSLNE